jgi:hypothetical protein
MFNDRQIILVRWFIVGSLLLLVSELLIAMIKHPLVITTAGTTGAVYLVLFVSAVLIYGWFALYMMSPATPAERVALGEGTRWGALCGLAWAIEVLVANYPIFRSERLTFLLYESTALAGFLLPALPGLLATRRTKRIESGLRAGLLCGLLGGLMIFLASLIFSAFIRKAGYNDPQTIAEFQRSGVPDLATYKVGDYLAGLTGHLWIGVITGSVLGVLGGTLGKLVALKCARPLAQT